MSAIKYGEKNIQKGPAPKSDAAAQKDGRWEEKNQGDNRSTPTGQSPQHVDELKTKPGDKRYLLRK